MDIKDAKPTCGYMIRDNQERTCTLAAGHAGLHHWRPYPNASSGSIWDDSLAASPYAERDATPTTEEVKTLREDMAEIAKRKPLCLSPSKSWQPTYEDWVKERNDAVARADERDAYAKQVETLTKERDACKAQLIAVERERDLAKAAGLRQVAEVDRVIKEVAQAKAASAKFCHAWQVCEATSKKQDEALKVAELAMDHLAKERDLARSELDLCTGRLQTAKEEVASLLKRAECSFMNAQQEIELLRASLAATQAELERARQTTDESLPSAGPPCPHSMDKQVGSSSYVIRRCKLADGHDGMCEPA